MLIRLSIKTNQEASEREFAGPSITMGRNPNSDIMLEQDSPVSVVSYNHGRIDLMASGCTLTDLDSSNGTYLDGQRIRGTVPLLVKDVFRLGATGPEITVLQLDLTLVAQKAAPRGGEKLKRPPGVNAKPQAAEASATRMMLLSALDLQKRSDSRLRQRLLTGSGVVAAIVLLIFLLLWRTDTKADQAGVVAHTSIKTSEKNADEIIQIKKEIEEQNERFRAWPKQLATLELVHKDEIRRLEQVDDKLTAMARQAAQDAQEQRRRDKDLENKLAAQKATPVRDENASAATNLNYRLQPGQPIDLYHRNSVKPYKDQRFVDMTSAKLRVMSISETKPVEYDLKDILAIETRDGVLLVGDFGYLESAFAFFELDSSQGQFVKTSDRIEQKYCERGLLDVPTGGFAYVMWGQSPCGRRCIGLPNGKSFGSFPAEQIKTVETPHAVWTFNPATRNYDAVTQKALADERSKASDKRMRNDWEARNQRLKDAYEAGTRRIDAIARATRWWW